MEMSEARPDTFNEGYTHQFQPGPTQTHPLLAPTKALSLKISSNGTSIK